jgi:hybrid cluster-associated redox disulfide protein
MGFRWSPKGIVQTENPKTSKDDFMSLRITGETIIGDILDFNADCAPFFLEMGMHCLGCPSARGESLSEACAVHGVDASVMADKLNAFLESG